MEIQDLDANDEQHVRQVAALLVEGFREHWPAAWPTLELALHEVHESLGEGRISRIAVDSTGTVLGWIAGERQYRGHSWELHPLVVRPGHQSRGIGRALVQDFEEQVGRRGTSTIWLGTDDEANRTSLGGVDLYPNVLEQANNIKNLRGHPYEFYQRLGYVIVGVLPDANGPGKPDILMAKRVDRACSPSGLRP